MLLLVFVAFLAACGASPPPPSLPSMPSQPRSVPEHLSSKKFLDELSVPRGETPTIINNKVCYGEPAHRRLALSISSDKDRSDARARAAWMAGWLDCQDAHRPFVTSALSNHRQSPTSTAGTVIGSFAVGALAFFLIDRVYP